MPDTAVTRPVPPGAGAQQSRHAHERLQHEVVEGPAREGHPARHGERRPARDAELAQLQAHRGRKARVELAMRDVSRGRGPRAANARSAARAKPAQRVQLAALGERDHVVRLGDREREDPALARDCRRSRRRDRAEDQPRRLIDVPLRAVELAEGKASIGLRLASAIARAPTGSRRPRVGILRRHLRELRPQRRDLAPVRLDRSPSAARSAFSIIAYCDDRHARDRAHLELAAGSARAAAGRLSGVVGACCVSGASPPVRARAARGTAPRRRPTSTTSARPPRCAPRRVRAASSAARRSRRSRCGRRSRRTARR